MRDLLTYSVDVAKIMPEVVKKFPDRVQFDAAGNPVEFVIDKTPDVRSGRESLSVIRCSDADAAILSTMTYITVLSDVPAGGDVLAAMSPKNRTVYYRVRGPLSVQAISADGTITAIARPALIGAFA